MTDPFDALYAGIEPREPNPEFAAELRAQLERAILAPEGDTMTTTQGTIGAQTHSISAYLAVTDARAALEFYTAVFDATRRGEPIVMPDGVVGHAEVAIGDSVLMLAEEFAEIGHTVAPSGGAMLRVEVSDVDEALARAVSRGASVDRPAEDGGHGRVANIRDPFGQRWMLAQAAARTDV
ncbi:putative glyoxalase superfamily protein PhnB [Tamaricihabitans halophyticus]|uniref:Putative glyoxalase superfamily protein PhnB n=1 Tax=Tamaricihabitans halophyticus TaxID=1262583 RepID=A0A4R2R336_9PSEU|nr:VOC family protein [Tamaricihabitans halophyticus]TCP57202.1 putative glyoxalase superfamily protein PhnB [Tamaricihabitans halophyticus]